jgi:hypothetical protein
MSLTKQPKPKLTREQKALKMFEGGVLAKKTDDGWEVPSETNGDTYTVSENYDVWNCTCPDAMFRSHQGELCKHSLLVIMIQESYKMHERVLNDKHDIHLHKNKLVVC